ncbi:hypothetical protein L7F22_018457 [Adiantum nelumboides]|nr:hypothetical protein [Adiantum nelumboides]
MGRSGVLNDALRTMYNAERRCKRQVVLKTTSNLLENFLAVMQKHGFVGDVRREVENRVARLHVELHGRLNKVGACTPRYEVGVSKIRRWADRLLPMKQVSSTFSKRVVFVPSSFINFFLAVMVVAAMLEELQSHVESIDMANDLHAIGGLLPLLTFLKNPNAGIRARASEVVSTMVQNNPKCQQLVMEEKALESLLSNFMSDPDVTVRTKSLGAISSLIRNNKPGVTAFRLKMALWG